MIHAKSLSKSYGDLQVLRSVDVTIEAGRVTGLAGPNASGKSTLIKSILGLVVPDSGELWVDGEKLNSHAGYRDKIGYMPQDADFPPNLKPKEYFGLLQSLRAKASKLLPALVESFELEPHLQKPFASLSAGTRQKVAAVGALMFEAPLLILDEPTAGLDPLACNTFRKHLKLAQSNGASILIVSHIMSELEQLVDNLIFLLDGRVLFGGEVAKLRKDTDESNLEEAIVRLMAKERQRTGK